MKTLKIIFFTAVIFSLGAGASFFFFQHKNHIGTYEAMHRMHHGEPPKQGSHQGAHHQHDEVNMPGLQGKDTTPQEVEDLKTIFRFHTGIKREVVNLPNGIKTVTEAEDSALRDAIVTHVSMMVTRLEEGKNPEVIIQSPTLDALFEVYTEIETEIETTDLGIAVTQTSANPAVVALLQTHAAEVSDMSARGMAAVHERIASHGH